MKAAEYISLLQARCKTQADRKQVAGGIPLGIDEAGDFVFSRRQGKTFAVQHTCVTGSRKTAFIKRLVLTLSRVYTPTEANFFILSPYVEYGELLKLEGADITVPYVRNQDDLSSAREVLNKLKTLYAENAGCLKLFLVLDGLEELEGCNQNADLAEYRDLFDFVTRQPNVEVISGVELMRSIFSGYPGAFVGLGNCLVTTREHGKADVTFVDDDSSLSLPIAMTYADLPTVEETVMAFNEEKTRVQGEDE
jgi:hypothetical protein